MNERKFSLFFGGGGGGCTLWAPTALSLKKATACDYTIDIPRFASVSLPHVFLFWCHRSQLSACIDIIESAQLARCVDCQLWPKQVCPTVEWATSHENGFLCAGIGWISDGSKAPDGKKCVGCVQKEEIHVAWIIVGALVVRRCCSMLIC